MKKLREEINDAAEAAGINRKTLAQKAVLSESYLSMLLSGNKPLNPDVVKRFATVLEVSLPKSRRWHRLGAAEAGWEIT